MLDDTRAPEEFNLEDQRMAGFWIRVAAYLIDFLVLLVFAIGALFMKSVASYMLLVIPVLAYKPVLEGILGGTAGKLALGLRVINPEGKVLGLAGAVVRSGLFILAMIPGTVLQIKRIESGISVMDPQAMQTFQEANVTLNYANYTLVMLTVVSCLVVAFHSQKRGLHDLMADSYVVYQAKEGPEQ